MQFYPFDSDSDSAESRLPLLRTKMAHARDAADVLGILIKTIEQEFPTIAQELSLTNETSEKVVTLVNILGGINQDDLYRQIYGISAHEINKMQMEAADLYEKLREQIASFMNKAPAISDPLERKNLIQALMKDCVSIIEESFPDIRKKNTDHKT